jgi:hypothetical protein
VELVVVRDGHIIAALADTDGRHGNGALVIDDGRGQGGNVVLLADRLQQSNQTFASGLCRARLPGHMVSQGQAGGQEDRPEKE